VKTRILVIDDDDLVRSLLRQMLERSGYEVTEAVDGAQGMRIFNEDPTDLVITDLLMPVMSGTKLILKLQSRFPDLKIIAISGGGQMYESGDYLSFAKELGAHRILQKPISMEELLRAVQDVMGREEVKSEK
jgi:CheY-like chemotaxis protein